MSEIKYGLISRVDANVLEKTIDLICEQFPKELISTTEVGLFNCQTSHGLLTYTIFKKGRDLKVTGIDNERDKPIEDIPKWMNFIKGNSGEVYNKLEDNSQHLILIDALHTFPAVVADFFCYAPKVKVGGFLCFHDTGRHLDPLSGWQGVGDKNDPDFCLGGVRKALKAIGLFGGISFDYGEDRCDISNGLSRWELIFDEADPEDTGGGITVFKKMY